MAMILPFSGPTGVAFSCQEEPLPVQWPRIPYFFTLAPERGLDRILEEPYQVFLETGEYHALDASLMQILSSAPDFALSLTTPTAYYQKVASTVSRELCRRFGFHSRLQMHLTTCLHEALIASVVHANCDIDMAVRSSEEFDAHYALIARRMAQAPYRDRRISITFWDREREAMLAVAHQGRAFAPAASQAQPLFLIERLADKVWIGDDQRTLFMSFTH